MEEEDREIADQRKDRVCLVEVGGINVPYLLCYNPLVVHVIDRLTMNSGCQSLVP